MPTQKNAVETMDRMIRWYKKQTPFFYRFVEGLSTGSMMMTAMSCRNMDLYSLVVFLCQWISSFLFHVCPSRVTIGVDYMTIHELILTRLGRVNPWVSLYFRILYVIYAHRHITDPRLTFFLTENVVMSLVMTVSVAFLFRHDGGCWRYMCHSGLLIGGYTLKKACIRHSHWIGASLMSTLFHLLLGLLVHDECEFVSRTPSPIMILVFLHPFVTMVCWYVMIERYVKYFLFQTGGVRLKKKR